MHALKRGWHRSILFTRSLQGHDPVLGLSRIGLHISTKNAIYKTPVFFTTAPHHGLVWSDPSGPVNGFMGCDCHIEATHSRVNGLRLEKYRGGI